MNPVGAQDPKKPDSEVGECYQGEEVVVSSTQSDQEEGEDLPNSRLEIVPETQISTLLSILQKREVEQKDTLKA